MTIQCEQNPDMFYCYDRQMSTYLTNVKNIRYITVAINPKNNLVFSQYLITPRLQDAISEFKNLKNNNLIK